MKAGFRGWLYRWMSALVGLIGLIFFTTLVELSRFYGYTSLSFPAWIGLGVSFLIGITAWVGSWSWKRYFILSGVVGPLFAGSYLIYRPEMIRDDVLAQLGTPPLSVDLLFYRTLFLKNDPDKTNKIERLQIFYSLLKSYGKEK